MNLVAQSRKKQPLYHQVVMRAQGGELKVCTAENFPSHSNQIHECTALGHCCYGNCTNAIGCCRECPASDFLQQMWLAEEM